MLGKTDISPRHPRHSGHDTESRPRAEGLKWPKTAQNGPGKAGMWATFFRNTDRTYPGAGPKFGPSDRCPPPISNTKRPQMAQNGPEYKKIQFCTCFPASAHPERPSASGGLVGLSKNHPEALAAPSPSGRVERPPEQSHNRFSSNCARTGSRESSHPELAEGSKLLLGCRGLGSNDWLARTVSDASAEFSLSRAEGLSMTALKRDYPGTSAFAGVRAIFPVLY